MAEPAPPIAEPPDIAWLREFAAIPNPSPLEVEILRACDRLDAAEALLREARPLIMLLDFEWRVGKRIDSFLGGQEQ